MHATGDTPPPPPYVTTCWKLHCGYYFSSGSQSSPLPPQGECSWFIFFVLLPVHFRPNYNDLPSNVFNPSCIWLRVWQKGKVIGVVQIIKLLCQSLLNSISCRPLNELNLDPDSTIFNNGFACHIAANAVHILFHTANGSHLLAPIARLFGSRSKTRSKCGIRYNRPFRWRDIRSSLVQSGWPPTPAFLQCRSVTCKFTSCFGNFELFLVAEKY